MKWLSPMDMEEILSRESQHRTQPSGEWLLRHEVFQAWLRCQHRSIWISGLPGSGKTVLSTVVIDTVRDHIGKDSKQMLAFFFCDKSDENGQSALKVFASIIGQVLGQFEEIPDHMYAPYRNAIRYGRSCLSTLDQPTTILKDLASSFNKLYILIDGLDELCEAAIIIESIKDLMISATNIHLILLSRNMPTLKHRLKGFLRIELTSNLVSSDINNFISRELPALPIEDPELLEHVFQRLSQSSNGMFLWTSLMIQSLKSATSQYEMKEILSDLPIGLDETYCTVINKLAKESPRRRTFAKKLLLFICCSARPLNWNELQSLMAFEKSKAHPVECKKPFQSAVLELGSSLVEYTPATDRFRLTHSSIREFLLSSPNDHKVDEVTRAFFIQEDVGHSELAEICLMYQTLYISHASSYMESKAYPFLEYSVLFWCHHVCRSIYNPDLAQRIVEFLSPMLRRQTWILRFLNWQSATFPLQYLMKLQNMLGEWIAQGQGAPFNCDSFNWIQVIPQILLCDADPIFRDQDSTSYGDLSLLQKLVPPISHFEKLMVVRDLSREYTMRGTLLNGERWLKNALDNQRIRRGFSHISTAWLMNSLGIIYDQQHRTSLSAQTQESALAIQTSVLGPDHLETIWTVNELGRIYRHLNDFNKAEVMHQRALTVLRNALHPQDLQIAWTLNTLARTYRRQCRFSDAIALHDQALDIQCAVLGELHPHTLWATMDKAACYLEQRHLRESADLYRKALEGRETVLGPKHADTLWAVNNLGLALEGLGRIEAAKGLQERALRGQTETLGRDHPHTVWSRDVLARLNEGGSGDCGKNAALFNV